jgi:hypothetical protein
MVRSDDRAAELGSLSLRSLTPKNRIWVIHSFRDLIDPYI